MLLYKGHNTHIHFVSNYLQVHGLLCVTVRPNSIQALLVCRCTHSIVLFCTETDRQTDARVLLPRKSEYYTFCTTGLKTNGLLTSSFRQGADPNALLQCTCSTIPAGHPQTRNTHQQTSHTEESPPPKKNQKAYKHDNSITQHFLHFNTQGQA